MRRFACIFFILLSCSRPQGDSNTIQFWQFWTDINTKPVIEQLIADFERENPGIHVKVTDLTWANGHDKIVISFAAHQPPDIVELGSDWIAEFAANGLLSKVKPSTPESYLYPAKWENAVYAYPWMLDSRYLYYNLDLLRRIGKDTPRTGMTYYQIAEALILLARNISVSALIRRNGIVSIRNSCHFSGPMAVKC